jgi:uncharacterized SAM-binding protein YcdF (DUF218 family)
VSSFFAFIFFSSPAGARFLMQRLEKAYPATASYDSAAAIVLLGGAGVPAGRTPFPETNFSADRILHAARLYKMGCAPYIIISGGKYQNKSYNGSEARTDAVLLTSLFCIDSSRIILEEKAGNTHEHGIYLDSLFKQRGLSKRIILVTSAYHMPRSVKVLRKYGFNVFPAPADFYTGTGSAFYNLSDLLPNMDYLFVSTIAWHEYLGIAVYSFRNLI